MKNFFLLMIFLFLPLFCLAENADLFPVYDETSGKWGYQNTTGQWVIPPSFDEADPFLASYACVSVDKNQHAYNRYGIINIDGRMIVPPEYYIYNDNGDEETPSDLYVVSLVGDTPLSGFFDTKSGVYSGLKWHEVLGRMACDHLVPVLDENGRAGYASRESGDLVIPCLYASVYPASFSQGIAAVAYEDPLPGQTEDYFLMDETGAVIPLPEGITAVYGAQAQDSRILIQEKATGLYGYASLEGNVVIPPRYSQAQDFCGGYARVTQGEKTFFIDPQGNPASQAP